MANKGVGYLSPAGVNWILEEEGWTSSTKENYKSGGTAYHQSFDASNVITVGPGCTNLANSSIKNGQHYTFEQICYYFNKEIKSLGSLIDRNCPQVKNFGSAAIDAVIIYAYNVGNVNRLKGASSAQDLAQKISSGPVTANGSVLSGLVKRRRSEANIILGTKDGNNSAYFGNLTQKTKDVISCCGGDFGGYNPPEATSTDGGGGDTASSGAAGAAAQKTLDLTKFSTIKSAPNKVYKLASAGSKDNVTKISDDRKKEFSTLKETMLSNTPTLGRDIITSDELYDSNILKTNQEAKRTTTKKSTTKNTNKTS